MVTIGVMVVGIMATVTMIYPFKLLSLYNIVIVSYIFLSSTYVATYWWMTNDDVYLAVVQFTLQTNDIRNRIRRFETDLALPQALPPVRPNFRIMILRQ